MVRVVRLLCAVVFGALALAAAWWSPAIASADGGLLSNVVSTARGTLSGGSGGAPEQGVSGGALDPLISAAGTVSEVVVESVAPVASTDGETDAAAPNASTADASPVGALVPSSDQPLDELVAVVSETGQALGDSGQGSPLIAATDGVAASVPALVPVTGAVDQVAGPVLAATTTANLPGETLGPVLNVANETTEPVSALVGASADGIGSLVAPVIATVDSARVSPITTLLDVVNSTIHPLAVAVEDIASGTLSPVVEVVTDVVGAPSTVIDDAIVVPSLTPSATPTAGPPGSVARPSTASLAGRDSPAVIEPAQWPGSLLPRPDYESQGLGSLEPNASPIATVTRSATSEAAASQTRDGSPVSRTREALSWVSGVVSGERVTSGGPAGLSAVLAGLLVLLLIPAIAAMANVALLAPRSPSFVPVHPPD